MKITLVDDGLRDLLQRKPIPTVSNSEKLSTNNIHMDVQWGSENDICFTIQFHIRDKIGAPSTVFVQPTLFAYIFGGHETKVLVVNGPIGDPESVMFKTSEIAEIAAEFLENAYNNIFRQKFIPRGQQDLYFQYTVNRREIKFLPRNSTCNQKTNGTRITDLNPDILNLIGNDLMPADRIRFHTTFKHNKNRVKELETVDNILLIQDYMETFLKILQFHIETFDTSYPYTITDITCSLNTYANEFKVDVHYLENANKITTTISMNYKVSSSDQYDFTSDTTQNMDHIQAQVLELVNGKTNPIVRTIIKSVAKKDVEDKETNTYSFQLQNANSPTTLVFGYSSYRLKSGGRVLVNKHTKRATKTRVLYKGTKRIVYVGIRGGQYIRLSGSFISVASLKIQT